MLTLTRLRRLRTVTCPTCKGEGHLSAPAAEWERWVRAHTAAAAAHEVVLNAYQAGEATRADLDAVVIALTDQGMSAPDGHVCETCEGYQVMPRQVKRWARRVKPLRVKPLQVNRWARRAA